MSEETPVTYAIRVMPIAHAEISLYHARIAAVRGEIEADNWQDGLEEAISHLATAPIRPQIAEQEHFRSEIRQLLYRSQKGAAAYRVLYRVLEQTPDGPQVQVVSARHASAQPIQAYEARQIEGQWEDQ